MERYCCIAHSSYHWFCLMALIDWFIDFISITSVDCCEKLALALDEPSTMVWFKSNPDNLKIISNQFSGKSIKIKSEFKSSLDFTFVSQFQIKALKSPALKMSLQTWSCFWILHWVCVMWFDQKLLQSNTVICTELQAMQAEPN